MASYWLRILPLLAAGLFVGRVVPANLELYQAVIQPLLRERCWACHGALQQKGGLRLDTVAAMRAGGDSGPVIHAGHPRSSLLLARVASADVEERMPPEHEGVPLDASQVATLREWIEAGAPAPANERPEPDPRQHWAFRAPAKPVPAIVGGPGLGPVDALLDAARTAQGLRARPEAPRHVLIRRLFIDLIGLPPSAEERESAMSDPAPDWYERWVDRLLADPRHGERWARHWMDLWRYSDAWGLGEQLRNSQKHIHHWRDWMIESLNADVPYDEMVRLMLAADELHPEDPGRVRATGYLARNFFLFNRNQWLDETVEHMSKAFLGLTLNCAKCHDHKYDPFPQTDYYRMRAFFEPYHVRLDVRPGEPDLARDGVPRAYDRDLDRPTFRFVRGNENAPDTQRVIRPGVPALLGLEPPVIRPVTLPLGAFQPERRPWVLEAHVDAARQREARATQRWVSEPMADAATRAVLERDAMLASAELAAVVARADAMRAAWRLGEAGATTSEADAARVTAVRAERKVSESRALLAVAEAEQRLATAEPSKREAKAKELEAARKKASEAAVAAAAPVVPADKPTPLVGAAWSATRFLDSTKDDPNPAFPPESTGRRTALARWMTDHRNPLTARVAVNHVWSRHMGAPLVPTVFDFGRKGSPPDQQPLLDWLAVEFMEHGWSLRHLHRVIVLSDAYRMESSVGGAAREMSRDPENRHWWRRVPTRMEAQVVRDSILAHAGALETLLGGPSVAPEAQAASRRRSLYLYHSNNDRNLFLATFDDATVKECYRRDVSVVPQQALALMNARSVQDVVPDIARRIEGRAGLEDDAGFVREAFRTLLGFDPGPREVEATVRAMEAWRKGADAGPGASRAAASRRAREGVAWALLNHGDFVTLR